MGDLFSGPDIKAPKASTAVRPVKTRIDRASKAAKNLSPAGFNAGGLSAKFNNGKVTVGASGQRQGLVRGLAGRFAEQAGLVEGLRGRVAPGVSELRQARLQEVANARQASISNLRDNLARRRVLGSSFAEDAVARQEKEFGQEAERVAAESFLQEIDLTNQFVQQEFDLKRQSIATVLNEFNLQADVASKLTEQADRVLTDSAQFQALLALGDANFRSSLFGTQSQTAVAQADLDAKAQAGAGRLIGKVAGVAAAPFTGGTSLALAAG